MTKDPHEEALRILKETFEDRIVERLVRRRRLVREGEANVEGPLAFVLPVSAEEVELLAEVAERHYVPLVVLGAGTAPRIGAEEGGIPDDVENRGILVRFDLMRSTRLPSDAEDPWAEAEPGALWLELDNDLRARGRSLSVYPTSAPRATVGGWLALDGIGVGSFEYGRLRENVLSADVVLPGGKRRTVQGEELRFFVGPGGTAGIVVGATLRTRRADADVPFATTFDNVQDLISSVMAIAEARIPLWHLAFLNPEMTRARGFGEEYMLFGAYPEERTAEVNEYISDALESYRGCVLPAADAYRVWGERFFPMAPSHPTPSLVREFVTIAKLSEALGEVDNRSEHTAVQGTVVRSGEVLLLTFSPV